MDTIWSWICACLMIDEMDARFMSEIYNCNCQLRY
jgi:hypothetical protein